MNESLKKIKSKSKFLIASHRGCSAGNIVENTYLAVKTAIISGADIVEIDLSVSKDGVVYVFHDGNEKRLLNICDNIHNLDSDTINDLKYINSIGNFTDYSPEKLSFLFEKLTEIKDKFDFLINIDRSWNFFDRALDEIEKFEIKSRCIIKTPLEDKYLDILRKRKYKFMYMPIIKNEYDMLKYKSTKKDGDINFVGIEYSGKIKDESIVDYFLDDEIIWINSLRLGVEKRLYQEYDDYNSISNYPDNIGWKKLLEKGFNTIQTDFPALLKNFRDLEI